jgi:hypothetical protein
MLQMFSPHWTNFHIITLCFNHEWYLNYSLECIHYLSIVNKASIIFYLLTSFFTILFLLANLFTNKFVHHIFQCHNFSWVSFIYIFFTTIDLASFFGFISTFFFDYVSWPQGLTMGFLIWEKCILMVMGYIQSLMCWVIVM